MLLLGMFFFLFVCLLLVRTSHRVCAAFVLCVRFSGLIIIRRFCVTENSIAAVVLISSQNFTHFETARLSNAESYCCSVIYDTVCLCSRYVFFSNRRGSFHQYLNTKNIFFVQCKYEAVCTYLLHAHLSYSAYYSTAILCGSLYTRGLFV